MTLAQTVLFVLSLAIAANVDAQWYDATTGEAVPEAEWRQQSGKFRAMLSITADAEQFLKEWYETGHDHIPSLTTTSTVKKGDIVDAFVFFSGCGNEEHSCDAIVSFKVIAPDGSVYGEHGNIPALPADAPAPRGVALSQARLRVRIEPQDLLGVYEVTAALHRPSTGQTLGLKTLFEVEP